MRCEHCGHEVHAFKEVKQAMANEGFDRPYLQVEIKAAIDAAVTSAISSIVNDSLSSAVRRNLDDYMCRPSVQKQINEAVGEAIRSKVKVTLV